MSVGGWFFLVISLSFVWSLLIWCYKKILTGTGHIEEGPDLL